MVNNSSSYLEGKILGFQGENSIGRYNSNNNDNNNNNNNNTVGE